VGFFKFWASYGGRWFGLHFGQISEDIGQFFKNVVKVKAFVGAVVIGYS
jgi:hypothetical protein